METEKDPFGPEYVVRVQDPKIGMEGFLVIHNTALGLGKGGIRMTETVTEHEVYRLAETMTWKNALAGIPFGGAKAGLVWKGGSDTVKKQHVQSFARALRVFIPKLYIAGPDVNSGEKEMKWIADELGNFQASTGKPSNYVKRVNGKRMAGLPHEYGSTGFGVAHSAAVTAQLMGLKIKGATVAIEGFGNVGTFAFKFLSEMGAKVVAVADSKGAIYSEAGLSYEKLMKTKAKTGIVSKHNEGKSISRDEFWGLKVDILIPAGVTDSIHEGNKRDIKAKLIVEGANIPMSLAIENELLKRGVVIVPDFVANAGGVISSYAEYKGFDPEKMFRLVKQKVRGSTQAVMSKALKSKKSPRTVGMELAVAKVKQAMKAKKATFR